MNTDASMSAGSLPAGGVLARWARRSPRDAWRLTGDTMRALIDAQRATVNATPSAMGYHWQATSHHRAFFGQMARLHAASRVLVGLI